MLDLFFFLSFLFFSLFLFLFFSFSFLSPCPSLFRAGGGVHRGGMFAAAAMMARGKEGRKERKEGRKRRVGREEKKGR